MLCTHPPVHAGAAIFFLKVKQPSWAEEPSPGFLLLAWKSYGESPSAGVAGWEAAPCCPSVRQHEAAPEQGLEGAPCEEGSLARVVRLLCSVLLTTVPIPCSRIPLPPSQPEQSSQVRTQQHKDSRCSVLILISNFTSTSGLSYWCFCPCADAALEAECCCVSEGAASLGSRCASSRLQQKSALKPDQLPPSNNKMGNTALSTEPGWEVAPRVPSSVTAPGQSSKVWQFTHPMGDICCSVSRIWNICTPQSVWDGNGHFCFSCHSAGVSEQCHSSQQIGWWGLVEAPAPPGSYPEIDWRKHISKELARKLRIWGAVQNGDSLPSKRDFDGSQLSGEERWWKGMGLFTGSSLVVGDN